MGESTSEGFQENFLAAAKVLSHEATKFAIAHSSPPLPEPSTTKNLAGSLCNAANQLVGCYLMLPTTVGATFLDVVRDELESLLTNLRQFLETVQNIVVNNEKLESCLQTTGILWECCDRLPSLPKNNAEAVIRVLGAAENLITDAIEELDESREIEEENEDDDSDNDETAIRGAAVTLLPSVKGLIKSSAALIRKTKKLVSSYSNPDQTKLDPLVKVSILSTVIDDIICCLYTPINVSQALEHANVLSSHVGHILDTVKGIAGEEDQRWIDLLSTAVQHNLSTLQNKVSLATS